MQGNFRIHRNAFAGLLLTASVALFLQVAGPAAAQAPELVEGKSFVRLKNPQPVETGKKIEVIEFFSYGCPHCADLDPILQTWMRTLPPDVQFRRVPVMFNDTWVPLAKIYYTLDALGEEGRVGPQVFTAIHQSQVKLTNDKTFFDWAASKGLDRKKVEDMYGSFSMTGKVNRARSSAPVYGVQSVPTLVVDGKFVTDSQRSGSHDGIPAVLNGLIVKARAERPKS